MTGLGMYAAITGKYLTLIHALAAFQANIRVGMTEAFQIPQLNSFLCVSGFNMSG